MAGKAYDIDRAEGRRAAKRLAETLKTLPDHWVVCRDMLHAWAVENDFHVTPMATVGRKSIMHISRELVCMRCGTVRKEKYHLSARGGLEKVGQSYEYPEGYQIPGVPRGVKPSHIVRQEQYRRAMERVAGAERGQRETAER